ncbi:MAG: DUF1684 domain-containing protein [Candidatus Heimdallarchaeaceae archaeon]|jgi:uncharacterized protein (DUF1684 family)
MVEVSYAEKIEKIRERFNKSFLKSPNSPLTAEQKLDFKGLSYFPIDEKYKITVEMKKFDEQNEITILSSKGDERKYIRFAFVEFDLEGQKNRLVILKPLKHDYLFLAFKDKTTGNESYKGGRYVEIEKLPENKIIIDFNLAYSPLCAYNDRWNCAGVPEENTLQIPISAGLKKYDDYRSTT